MRQYKVCPEGIQPCNMKNRGIYLSIYKIQEILYLGQWCLSPPQSRHPGTSHSSPNRHQLSHSIFWVSSTGWNLFPFTGDFSPGWCSSVDWVLVCKPKGHWSNPQSGHMLGLQARSPFGGEWKATTHWCFLSSLSPPFPLSLEIDK